MSNEKPTFSTLAQKFAEAVESGRNSASNIPFVALEFKTLMEHKAETDDDKRQITAQASGLLAYSLSRISRPEYTGHYQGGSALLNPLFEALEMPGALPFVPAEEASKIADTCVALAHNGPALLAKATANDSSDEAFKRSQENREELLALTRRTLVFADKCKEFRENLNLDAKTSKDISPAKPIKLRTSEPSGSQ